MTGTGGPRAAAMLREAWASAWARPIPAWTTALVVGIACVVTLATTGRTAATEHQVVSAIDSLNTRLITITDTTGTSEIDPTAVDLLSGLEGVAWVFGLGPARDVTIPALGTASSETAVPSRAVVGDLPPDLVLTAGRTPRVGEAIAGPLAVAALGLVDGTGAATTNGRSFAVVGTFEPGSAFGSLDGTVLTMPRQDEAPTVRYLYLRAADGYDVPHLARTVEALVPAVVPATVSVEISQSALDLRAVLSGTLGASARQLMGIVLITGFALVAVTVWSAVNARRRDFGRQRALGATRSAIVALVLIHTGIAGGVGAALGVAIGLPVTWAVAGALPSTAFVIGVATLAVLVALLGALVPAIAAARRDPVRILRVP